MSWLGIVVAVLALYFAFKVVGFMFRLFFVAIVIVGLYWFAAPYLG